jgi:hypothetical protein
MRKGRPSTANRNITPDVFAATITLGMALGSTVNHL